MVVAGLSLMLAALGGAPDQTSLGLPAARPCSTAEIRDLTSTPDAADTPFRLTCRAELDGRAVTRRILIEGAEASGAGIDCGGGSVGRAEVRTTTLTPTIAVWSRRIEAAGGPVSWSRPVDVTISNCTVHGAVRLWGMGLGRIEDLRASSRTAGHTAAAQAAAPMDVTLSDVTIVGTGSIPLYVGPGVLRTTVEGGRFAGRSVSTALYLDAESAGAVIRNSSFDLVTGRELIAVDGSAGNRIVDNKFDLRGRGGVFLYRNCGEDAVIRHQTPSNNIITGNQFSGASWWRPQTVVVGSREGRRSYCAADKGWPFGSSLDDGDHATGNTVRDNRTVR